MNELKSIIDISRRFGSDADMVQGGGGNTSVKFGNGKMYIKASGTTLEKADSNSFIVVDVNEALAILEDGNIAKLSSKERDLVVSKRLQNLVKDDSNKRPSIETFLHALLRKYVVHIHPVYVNALTCIEGGENLAEEIFKDKIKYLWVDYGSPGYPLGILLKNGIEKYIACNETIPEAVFLQNHGLIVSSDSEEEIYKLFDKIMKELKDFWGSEILFNSDVAIGDKTVYISLLEQAFAFIRIYSRCLQAFSSSVINYVLQRKNAKTLFAKGALYPDQIVYCGESPLYIEDDLDYEEIAAMLKEFIEAFGYPPKVIIFKDESVIFNGASLNEVEAIEETLGAHLKVLLLIENKGRPAFLTSKEAKYIANWESEKYRKKLIAGNA